MLLSFPKDSEAKKVFISPGFIIARGESIDAEPHSHLLWQLCFPTDHSTLNEKPFAGSAIIKPDETHQLNMSGGWIILAEPQSRLGDEISKLPESLITLKPDTRSLESLLDQLQGLGNLSNALEQNYHTCSDKRIIKLLDRLDECLSSDCLKPDHWRASDIADWLSISESRLLHLIKEQLGVAWRPYLLWRRLICALLLIVKGESSTRAAYQAGFSDSAHLSRTIKKTFGMTTKKLLASLS